MARLANCQPSCADGRTPHAARRIARVGARCGAVLHPLGDALQDGGDAEQVVGQVEVPIGRRGVGCCEPGALFVRRHVIAFERSAQNGVVEAADATEGSRRDVPSHAAVGEIGQRMPQRRQLPIQYRQHPRLARPKEQVVEAVVAVHDGGAAVVERAGRHVRRKPGHQAIHLVDRLGDGSRILLAPAQDLALEVAARLAAVGQARGRDIDLVPGGDDAVDLVVDRAALGAAHAGQRRVPQHAALDDRHDVESAADHSFVLATGRHNGAMRRSASCAGYRCRRLVLP